MKSIINGRRYDTDKAIEIGSSSFSREGIGDFKWWEATLYKTPRAGRYFLAGKGGPMTRWAKSSAMGTWTNSGYMSVVEMAPEDALAWAEQELSPGAIEEHFADLIEDA